MASSRSSEEPLLRRVPSALGVPPVVVQPGIEKLSSPATIPESAVFPEPKFTNYRLDARKRRMPQCIAHRGYKAAYPENTMMAFKGAVDADVQALETDVHITKDEEVVLSHDATLKRCFGRQEKIKDLEWKEIEQLRTIAKPHVPMPRLKDLLEYLAQPGMEEIWLLLDIKLDNDADAIMRLMGSVIAAAKPSEAKAWNERVVLGVWAAKYLPLAMKYLPGFPISHIGFSIPYARHFFSVPNVSFNMLLPMLIMPGGRSFIRDAQTKYHRQVYAWTVNEEDRMEWCIRRQLDGVVTDDPKRFFDVCKRFDELEKKHGRLGMEVSFRTVWDAVRIYCFISFMLIFFRKRFRPVASEALIKRETV